MIRGENLDASKAVHRERSEAAVHRERSEAAVHREISEAAVHREISEAAVHREISEAAVHREISEAAVHRKTSEAAVHGVVPLSWLTWDRFLVLANGVGSQYLDEEPECPGAAEPQPNQRDLRLET
jgi:hypothetical protein